MQADVSKVIDDTNPKKAKNVQLKYPIRLRVKKTPVIVHFDMHKVSVSPRVYDLTGPKSYFCVFFQTFNHHPYEIMRRKKKCRSDWYAKDRHLGCPRRYTPDGKKIFDSQVRQIYAYQQKTMY